MRKYFRRVISCPCNCENGKTYHSTYGSEKICSVCDGTGKLSLTKAKKIDLEYLFRNIN